MNKKWTKDRYRELRESKAWREFEKLLERNGGVRKPKKKD